VVARAGAVSVLSAMAGRRQRAGPRRLLTVYGGCHKAAVGTRDPGHGRLGDEEDGVRAGGRVAPTLSETQPRHWR
jgi:hypothetical protein